MNFLKVEKMNLIQVNNILIDFDRTLMKGNSISEWRVLYHPGLLGYDFTKRYDEIDD